MFTHRCFGGLLRANSRGQDALASLALGTVTSRVLSLSGSGPLPHIDRSPPSWKQVGDTSDYLCLGLPELKRCWGCVSLSPLGWGSPRCSLQVLALISHGLGRPVFSCYSLEFPETTSEDVKAPSWACLPVVTLG